MPTDTFKPRGPSKLSTPDSGGASTKQYPIIGVVKDNIDPDRSGKIRVAFQDGKGTVSPDQGPWTVVQHLSTFFGVVRANAGQGSENFGSYIDNSSSYGQWQAPPDIGTEVICIFVNGDENAGYYIGAVPQPETLQMVPAIGASERVTLNEGEAKSFGGATRLPVTNLNTNNKDKADSNEFLNTPRPVHSYAATIMNQQGILRDPIRGPISSSASRETASRVGWGVSTPGRPIYEGGYDDASLAKAIAEGKAKPDKQKIIARRGGHSIVMDDGDVIGRDQLIRIRTTLGHQIMMSDDGQTLMILHSNGESYIELGKEGTVDIFSTNSFNVRTQGDINFHADRDINMHAEANFNLQAKNIHTNSNEVTKSRAGTEYAITALNNFTVQSAAAIGLVAGGQASMAAGAEAFVNGTKVNLNSGSASLSPPEVPVIPITVQTDTLFDATVGWAAAPAKLLTIASRAPAHYPWVNAGMGVDISNSPDAADNLPEAPSAAVQEVNAQAAATNPTPPAIATVASVPPVPAVSPTMDKGTTNAVLAATATSAAAGEAATAVGAGAGIVNKTGSSLISGINSALSVASAVGGVINAANQVAGSINQAAVAIGSFAQTPKQLVQSGVLKPGADSLINGLASAGKTLTNALPSTLFAGKAGAESIEKLATNSNAQTASLVNVMKTAQQQLTQAGVINGSESNGQTAGLIAAASTVGTDAVVGVVKQVTTVTNTLQTAATTVGNIGSIANAAGVSLPGQVQTATNLVNNAQKTATALSSIATGSKDVLGAIGKGISAAKLSDSLGGLGGIGNSLKALGAANNALTGLLDSVKGISGSAFSAVKDAFGKLEANKPQILSDIAKETAAKAAVAGNLPGGQPAFTKSLSSLVSSAKDVVSNAANIANGINNTVGSLTGAASGALGAVTNAANTLNGITGTVSGVTKAINSVSGAASSISSAASSATGAINNITTTLSSAATAASNLAQLPNTINSGTINNTVVNSTAQLATAAGSVSNAIKGISNAVNNLDSAGQQVTTLINSTTGAGVNNLANSISGAFDNINSMAGAATSLSDGLSGLANAAKKTQSGGLAAKASQLSSGISNLPGGIKAFSSVLDKVDEAANKIPGTGELSGLMKNLQSEATNGLGKVSSALTSASTVVGEVGNALNAANKVVGSLGGAGAALGNLSSMASKAGGLTSAIAGKLPLGQAAQLLSSVSALGAGGASPIKQPSLGINTTNRTGITAQIKGVLGNPKIPEPNLLGDIKDETVDTLFQQLQTATKARNQAEKKYKALEKEFNVIKKDFDTKYNTLPDGDPALDEAFIKVKEIAGRLATAIDEYEKAIAGAQAAAAAGLRDTPGGRLFGI
jgi:hypothetical protein